VCAFLLFQGVGAAAACDSPGDSATDGLGELEGDNFDQVALGFNLGLTYMVSNMTTIGVAYRSAVDIEVEGKADFSYADNQFVQPIITGAGLFTDTDIEAEVTLPASLSFSVAHQVDKFTWLAD
jgi:long-chain fatty acid transport protein